MSLIWNINNFFYKYIYYIYFIYVWFKIYFLVNVFNLCMLLFDGNFFRVKVFIFWFVYLNCFRFVDNYFVKLMGMIKDVKMCGVVL